MTCNVYASSNCQIILSINQDGTIRQHLLGVHQLVESEPLSPRLPSKFFDSLPKQFIVCQKWCSGVKGCCTIPAIANQVAAYLLACSPRNLLHFSSNIDNGVDRALISYGDNLPCNHGPSYPALVDEHAQVRRHSLRS